MVCERERDSLFSFRLSGFYGRFSVDVVNAFQCTGDSRARVTTFCKEFTHLIGLRTEVRIITA